MTISISLTGGTATFTHAVTAETIKAGTFCVGANISGLELNSSPTAKQNFNYVCPSLAELQYMNSKGLNLVRLPIGWETLQPTLGGPLAPAYLALIVSVLNNAKTLGMKVIVDLHCFGGYSGNRIGSANGPTTAQFATVWSLLATALKGNTALFAYELANEPNNMPTPTTWTEAAQAAITAIRAIDKTTSIVVDGNEWSTGVNYAAINPGFASLTPQAGLIFTAHVYLDRDASGTHFDWDQEVSNGSYLLIGENRLSDFVQWLTENNCVGFVGELGVGNNNADWETALDMTLAYCKTNNLMVTYWAMGQWWGSYPMSIEPQNGVDAPQVAILEKYSTNYPTITFGVQFSGTADPNATVYLSQQETLLCTATADSSGTWTATATGLTNNTIYTVVASEVMPGADGTIASVTFKVMN